MITIGTLDGTQALTVPVMPASFEMSTEQDHQTVNIVELGEILLKGNAKLRTLTFSSFFPAQQYNFADTTDTEPYQLVNMIQKWKDESQSLRIAIDVNIDFSGVIQSFTYSEEDGTGDVSYSLSFLEEKKQQGKRAEKTVKATKYTCKKGDNFYKVARATTGSTANAAKIAKANKMKVNAKLKKGQKLVIKI